MYCVYSTILSKYYNFKTNTWTELNVFCITNDKGFVNTLSKELKPEIHIITTKPVFDEEIISVY